MKDLVIFDFDGTIVDTMNQYADIAADIFESYLKMPRDLALEAYWSTTGIPFGEQVSILTDEEWTRIRMSQDYHARKNILMNTCELFPEVKSTLRELKRRGITTAIVSSSNRAFVEACTKRLGIDVFWFSGTGIYADKFNQITILLDDFHPEGTVTYVGDSRYDEELAYKMGLEFVGIKRNDYANFDKGVRVVESLEDIMKVSLSH